MTKIINEMKQIILSDKNLLKNYQLIGFFGSSLESEDFNDIDLVTVGNDESHGKLKANLTKGLSKLGYNVVFFETIKHKPHLKDVILIHDLHYSSFENLYEKEWPDVINEIKNSLDVVRGSLEKIHKIDVKEKDFYSLWFKWICEINSEEEFNNFKDYIKKIIPKLYKIHKKLNLKKVGEEILATFNGNDWKISKNKIINILENQF